MSDSYHYYNPYSGETFFGVLLQLVLRLWAFIRGELSLDQLASDEIQIIVLIGVAISSALVGSFLVLRKMTMLAHSLSHTILVGIVLAFLWVHHGLAEQAEHAGKIDIHIMLLAALIMGLITAFLTEFLTKSARLQEDASTGLVFTTLFAIGVIALTVLTRNAHIGTEVIMGSVDSLQLNDGELVYTVLAINIVLFILFFKEFAITSFDSGLARALGLAPMIFNYLLMAQVSLTAIGAFRAVGVLMVLSFFTGPPLTAYLLTHNLKRMLVLSALIGVIASVLGVAITRHILTYYGIPLSTAGVVVCTIVALYIIAAFFPNRSKILYLFRRRSSLVKIQKE